MGEGGKKNARPYHEGCEEDKLTHECELEYLHQPQTEYCKVDRYDERGKAKHVVEKEKGHEGSPGAAHVLVFQFLIERIYALLEKAVV